jgi:hypothetical protein
MDDFENTTAGKRNATAALKHFVVVYGDETAVPPTLIQHLQSVRKNVNTKFSIVKKAKLMLDSLEAKTIVNSTSLAQSAPPSAINNNSTAIANGDNSIAVNNINISGDMNVVTPFEQVTQFK